MTEYVACVVPATGGTETVTVRAYNPDQAKRRLLAMGYREVIYVH